MHYKAPDNSLHFIDPDHVSLLPAGSIQITDEEAQALRESVPAQVPQVVDMAQARLALLQSGLYATVQAAVAGMTGAAGDAARIEWEFRATVRRDSPLVTALSASLGLTSTQLDDLFTLAATL